METPHTPHNRSRTLERPHNRSRTLERPHNRSMSSTLERPHNRSRSSTLERPHNRSRSRTLERPHNRSRILERPHNRSRSRIMETPSREREHRSYHREDVFPMEEKSKCVLNKNSCCIENYCTEYDVILLSLVWHSEFQKRVLYLLADMRAKLSEAGRFYEPPHSQFHLELIDSVDQLQQLNRQLTSEEKRKLMVGYYEKGKQTFANRCNYSTYNILFTYSCTSYTFLHIC